MKLFFVRVIFVISCSSCMFSSFAEELKSKETLIKEIKPLLVDIWGVLMTTERKDEEKRDKMKEYINDNMTSIYYEIDYLDGVIKKWDKLDYQKKNKYGIWKTNETFSVYPEEEDINSLLDYVVRRDEEYFKIMNDFADKFNVKSMIHKKRFFQLADYKFFSLNRYNSEVQKLGRKFYERSKGDLTFQMLIKSWFPMEFPNDMISKGTRKIMLQESDPRFEDLNTNAGDRQENMINRFKEKWDGLMKEILESNTQEEIDACAKKIRWFAYPLMEIASFKVPSERNQAWLSRKEKELREGFYKKIYRPMSFISPNLLVLTEEEEIESKKINTHLEMLESDNNIDTSSVKEKWTVLFDMLNKYRSVREMGGSNEDCSWSYLIDYSYNEAMKNWEYIEMGDGYNFIRNVRKLPNQ